MVYFYTPLYFCVNSYILIPDLKFVITWDMKLQECLKTIVFDIMNWSNWSGSNALYFEKCSQSTSQTVTIKTYTYATITKYFLGGTDVVSKQLNNKVCWPRIVGTSSTSSLGWLGQAVMQNFMNYLRYSLT